MHVCMYVCMYVRMYACINTSNPNITNRSAMHFKLDVVFISALRKAACRYKAVVWRFLVTSGSVEVHVSYVLVE